MGGWQGDPVVTAGERTHLQREWRYAIETTRRARLKSPDEVLERQNVAGGGARG